MKLSKVLGAIGRGAAIAAQFTPAGAAVTKGLDIAGKALDRKELVEGDEPDTARELAVEAVLANSGVILAAAITAGQSKILALDACTDAVEAWLQSEAQTAAASEAKEKAGGDGR